MVGGWQKVQSVKGIPGHQMRGVEKESRKAECREAGGIGREGRKSVKKEERWKARGNERREGET